MSGPTRQRSFRERLHGIGIPWQGKKSKSYTSKDGQTLAETVTDAPVEGGDNSIPSNEDSAAQKALDESVRNPPYQSAEAEKGDEKLTEHKELAHMEKKLLSRSFTQPKGTEEYRVKASDTLERIAARFDTTPSELAKLNRLTARMIFPGQMLFVPEKKGGGGASASGDSVDETKSSNGTDISDAEEHPDSQGNGKLGVSSENCSRRKVSVTDALRIPYRRHSDRMQRFMKVKARHFTDGQGVVAGVLIITPNAVMFDPNVSDPLVIEHGIESYGVIAPLDMVMRTAIYFDIAHMKVKNAPETQLNIPKPDIYYGKMINANVEEEKEAQTLKSEIPEVSRENTELQSSQLPQNQEKKPSDDKTSEQVFKDDEAPNLPESQKIEAKPSDSTTETILSSSEPGEERKKAESETDKDILSRDGSLDKEVSDAFANGAKKQLSGHSSVDSPTPPLPQQSEDGKQAPESRRERMLKRLSYPMESITSYTQSSLSRILSSSPKSFVDFSSGLFVRSSEEDKGKDSAAIPEVVEENEKEDPKDEEKEQPPNTSSLETKDDDKIKEVVDDIDEKNPNTADNDGQQSEQKTGTTFGYKNLVDEKPEFFALMDKLLKQHAAQEQEGPPLYLCLRMGHLKEKKLQLSTPILSYGKKKAKSEYWFSIPHSRVEDLYNFLQQWFPQLYGDVNDIDPEALGFTPIDDSAEDEEEEQPEQPEEDEKKDDEAEEDAQRRSTPRSFLKLVEDHFGFRSISPTDWEVLSMTESEKFNFEDFEFPIPELQSPSDIFQEGHIKELHTLLPPRAVGYPWTLVFSTSLHGFNLKTLYRKMSEYDTPALLVIEDTEGSIFGSLVSSSLKLSDHFYGNGESFLFTFYPEFKVYKWTGENMYFAKGNAEYIAMGSGDGQFGIWIDGDLNHGRSQKCLTFDNDVLCKNEDFVVKSLEVWGFV